MPDHRRAFEQEFLIRLAPVWLACRWKIMGNPVKLRGYRRLDLAFDMLGCMDYGAEMKLLCEEMTR